MANSPSSSRSPEATQTLRVHSPDEQRLSEWAPPSPIQRSCSREARLLELDIIAPRASPSPIHKRGSSREARLLELEAVMQPQASREVFARRTRLVDEFGNTDDSSLLGTVETDQDTEQDEDTPAPSLLGLSRANSSQAFVEEKHAGDCCGQRALLWGTAFCLLGTACSSTTCVYLVRATMDRRARLASGMPIAADPGFLGVPVNLSWLGIHQSSAGSSGSLLGMPLNFSWFSGAHRPLVPNNSLLGVPLNASWLNLGGGLSSLANSSMVAPLNASRLSLGGGLSALANDSTVRLPRAHKPKVRRRIPGRDYWPDPPIRWPEMYGKVKEKTIWSYWTDPKDCPSSRQCKMPPAIQLCSETVRKNRGSFDYKIVHKDEVLKYVTMMELPVRFFEMLPAQQKDALMNALLARYGGIALDVSTVLLRPLDEYWEEMVYHGATFWGYMYRITGRPWANSEVLAVWLLISRREGIFSSAVRSQVIGMGNERHPPKAWVNGGFHNPYFAMGDQILAPIVTMFNYSYPSCLEDPLLKHLNRLMACPELENPHWRGSSPGPERNDAKLLLREPREGPQLSFAFYDNFSMPLWHIGSNSSVGLRARSSLERSDQNVTDENPMPWTCSTMKECWEDEFLARYHGRVGPGQTRLLNFVKLFNSGGRMKAMTREEILADNGTFFYHWLLLAGLESLD